MKNSCFNIAYYTNTQKPKPVFTNTTVCSIFDKGYRYGFNGMEHDKDIGSDDYDFGARIYDGRIGRWLSLDPLMMKYPHIGPYVGIGNNPIFFIDPDGKKIVPSKDFYCTNYEDVHNYLMINNTSYVKLLGKYAERKNENFVLNLGTNDAAIPVGAGGVTKTSYTWEGEKSNIKVTKSIATSNFVTGSSSNQLNLWHFYIIIHEVTHATEYLSIKNLALLKDGNHNGFAKIRSKNVAVWNELNTELNLGLSKDDIDILSFGGAENSKAFNTYLTDKATVNKTTIEAERAIYDNRKNELYNTNVSFEKKEEVKPEVKPEEKKEEVKPQ